MSWILWQTTTRSWTIDIPDCLCGDEREFIWTDTDDRSVFFVKKCDIEMISTAENGNLQGNAGDGPEFWAREDAERGPIQIITDQKDEGEN